MKKIVSWVTTVLFSVALGSSGLLYLSGAEAVVEGVHGTLGYPLHFLPLLGAAKVLGVVALLVPGFPRIREWAYAGFAINLIGAAWAHANVDGLGHVVPVVVLGAVLATSYILKDERGGLTMAAVPARPAVAG